ncbi:MAG: ethylbenzene dehydrogenase-related protein [Desulfuromonadales bacterium]|nr:ethylbenzene dehydrogenase-related protein [Desulfuromonadales bacterium]
MTIFARFTLAALLFSLATTTAFAETAQAIISVKADKAPTIDGKIDEDLWAQIKPAVIKDQASGTVILLRSAYTTDKIYFSMLFQDGAKNPLHKPWAWDQEKETYETGKHREDTFVFKWSMMEEHVDLSNFSDDNYTADIWYWKANRTNPAGYADDKYQNLSDSPSKKSAELTSKTGKTRFLARRSDKGKPAYQEFNPAGYSGKLVDRYPKSTPEGSRADVIAKGKWHDGNWAIEFERRLDTGHSDDVQFNLSGKYLFGVSIFSLYGRPHDPNSPNLYGRGRISNPLILRFK